MESRYWSRSIQLVAMIALAVLLCVQSASASEPDPLDKLLPGDIILESASSDSLFQQQRIAYGAHFTHSSIYIGVRDGKHMVVEAVGPKHESRIKAIEDKYFRKAINDYQVVRIKRATKAQRELAARIAEKCFVGVPYGWQTDEVTPLGLIEIRRGLDKNLLSTLYCSSLVWNAWRVAGVDLDSDYVDGVGTFASALFMPKSYFVMPDDIAMSDEVQYVIDVPMPEAPEIEVLVPVPNVVGKPESAAKKSLKSVGLRVRVTRRHDSSRAGTVVEQSPKKGLASKGSAVELVISRGEDLVTVPDMFQIMYQYPGLDLGTPLDSIERFINKRLAGSGLRVKVEWGYDVPGGWGQSPRKGSKVTRGTTVRMRVLD